MPHLDWTDDLNCCLNFQNDDHKEAAELINALQTCEDTQFPDLYAALLKHTQEHLAREDALMDRIGFFAADIHKGEHVRVLAEMQAFEDKLAAGNIDEVRAYVEDTLPHWLINHLNSMDVATAMFARQAGES